MKELESRTGVSRETIHFYLREGLLPEPERPKRNVAHYSEDHVMRIRVIKRLQDEKFLPLSTIKNMLRNAVFRSPSAGEDLAAFELNFLSLLKGDIPTPDQPLAEVAARLEISEKKIRHLHALDIIEIKNSSEKPELDYRDVAIIEQWCRLLRLGFGEKSVYDEHYLKRYVDAVTTLSKVEADIFLEAFGDLSSDEAADLATRGIERSNEILVRLRTRALLNRLRERVGGNLA